MLHVYSKKNLPIPVLPVVRATIGVGSRNPTEKGHQTGIKKRLMSFYCLEAGPAIETVMTKLKLFLVRSNLNRIEAGTGAGFVSSILGSKTIST